MYFTYGEKELDFLRQKDKRLAEVIDRIGPVHRTVDTDPGVFCVADRRFFIGKWAALAARGR